MMLLPLYLYLKAKERGKKSKINKTRKKNTKGLLNKPVEIKTVKTDGSGKKTKNSTAWNHKRPSEVFLSKLKITP